jgi:hypothetical protein
MKQHGHQILSGHVFCASTNDYRGRAEAQLDRYVDEGLCVTNMTGMSMKAELKPNCTHTLMKVELKPKRRHMRPSTCPASNMKQLLFWTGSKKNFRAHSSRDVCSAHTDHAMLAVHTPCALLCGKSLRAQLSSRRPTLGLSF